MANYIMTIFKIIKNKKYGIPKAQPSNSGYSLQHRQ